MKKSILVVDDEELSRELLRQIFCDQYEVIQAENGKEAIVKINTHINELAIILLDLMMPGVNGYQILQALSAKEILQRVPVILITANVDVKVTVSCYNLGASDVIYKPFNAQIVRKRVQNVIQMSQSKVQLEQLIKSKSDELSKKERELEQFHNDMIDLMSNIVEFRSMESNMHIKRVKGFTRILAQTYVEQYPDCGLTPEKINVIVSVSSMHDIGKISIPESILLKPGKLTNDELQVMMGHTTKGCEIIEMMEGVQDSEHYQTCYDVCRYHHERYDGKGYPDGLAGDAIPLSAQLVAMADVYESLVSDRVYKKAYDKKTAFQMICNGECGSFSQQMTKTLILSKEAVELYADLNQ